MTRNETEKAIKVMQAYIDGKDIEFNNNGKIMEVPFPTWQWENNPTIYRVKPEPHYRPFENAGEVMGAIKEHGDWVRLSKGVTYHHIVTLDDSLIRLGVTVLSYESAFDNYVFADGTPFGKLEE